MLFNLVSLLTASTLAAAGVVSSESKLAHRLERRQGGPAGRGENDITCAITRYDGKEQIPPPVVIYWKDGSSSCGCASDIDSADSVDYEECKTISPMFGQSDYSDDGLRQNSCSLDQNLNAKCGTTCTPNTSPDEDDPDGNCSPTDPDNYSLVSPTTDFSNQAMVTSSGSSASLASASMSGSASLSGSSVASASASEAVSSAVRN